MFCKNCGAELNDGVKFCKSCGAEQKINKIQSSDILVKNAEDSQMDEEVHETSKESRSENQEIAVLKQSYFDSATSGSGAKKNFIILTQKWLHFKGRTVLTSTNKPLANISFATKDIIIPIQHVTGVEIFRFDLVARKWIAFMSFFSSFIIIVMFLSDINRSTPEILKFGAPIFAAISLLLGIVQVIHIVRYGKRIFRIHHIGGPTSVLARWYSTSALENFRKRLLECIENIK